ncbi:MAG: Holliday junction resolvase RuvX [Pirellulaceae bacterium]
MSDELPATGRLAAVDFGTVRIGLAVCDPQRSLASPYENYTRRGPAKDKQYFQQFADEERIVGFVVGLPVFSSGDESGASQAAREFGRWLTEVTGRPVRYFDERYTSAQAEQLLGDAGYTRKQRKKRLDMLAAQIILTSYLESTSGGQATPLED